MGAHVQHAEARFDHQAELGQIEKLISSSSLHDCESLCHLLRFLTQKSLSDPPSAVSEYDIAAEVFRRGSAFDPRNDSTVRVNMGRLRSRLAEYYAGEGGHDGIVVELPPRSYTVSFLHRSTARGEPIVKAPSAGLDDEPQQSKRLPVVAAVLILAVLVSASGFVLWRAAARPVAIVPVQGEALTTFWKDFWDEPNGPLVIFSNAKFTGTARTGLRYSKPGDAADAIVDQYTGVGEVMGIDALARVFFRFGHEMRVRRALNISWDEAKASSVIFLGSQFENRAQTELPDNPEFVFKFDTGLVNLHPRQGEAAVYSPAQTYPQSEDYALVSLHSGLRSPHRILILAGNGTLGTQAAAEYICTPVSVQQLLSKLGVRSGQRPPNFEAVLRVKISGGVPIHSDLIALHSNLK